MMSEAAPEEVGLRLIQIVRDRRRRHREKLAAIKLLGHDDGAWADLFRRGDWAPLPVGHGGRCGHCGAEIDPSLNHCAQCGAEWGPNARRADLYRQIVVLSLAAALSVLAGYASALWLRRHFDAAIARGEAINPEMIETLASFSWLLCGVLMMILLTYMIEHFHLAPIGHWRKKHPPVEAGGRRKADG
jgi:hypothetical protein